MGLGMPADLVRGQYAGYRDEPRVAKDSDVETYCDLWCRVLKGRALGERRTIRPARGTLNAS
ncbi:hypothetical protein [Rhodoferax ferrireducens]|uniref:hypothetical protein n=1 Tax=Rhodoferax ferrireducens TaxID=192843 RepID=UPI000E0CCA1A|nr:hypothetical protein [Rhodoferax ferrireducens]